MKILSSLAILTLCSTLNAEQAVQLPLSPTESAAIAPALSDIYKSVVRIEVASQIPDYKTPWNAGRFSGGTGTGFLIGKNQFLTNAHVVSNARRVLITMHGSSRKHPARVVHIAHDCDLALIEVEDFSSFEDLPHLSIGTIPKLESEVRVIGYPIGGERISVTRGVVSRIDFSAYSHSRADSHLVVQIDAAINPGNSGGPVLQKGKVVGVAFQGLRQADNTGYMIPTPVIKRFLTDIEDGKYDKYVDLGISPFALFNPAMRKVHNLGPNDPGVLVADVIAGSSSSPALQTGDILTAIDNHPVDSSGNIMIAGERVDMNEIVERKFAGDTVKLDFIRDGKEMSQEIELKGFPPAQMVAIQYGKKPRYIIQGGLVLQPLNINLYSAHKLNNPRVRRLFNDFVSEGLYKEREDILILTRVLDDPINSGISGYVGNAVKSINGIDITDIKQAYELLNPDEMPEFFEITLDGSDRPLILPTKELSSANGRISTSYGVHKSYNLEN
ncbi:trypsin-like peptidase domain-containing protein [Rubritalea spongiae]|uniref:Trypsin-like peptidase domain-containing protein n=1 Tax=Rubritalea spongiae TaxID=430797 RepID=A0ABW5E2V5_9BACT